ncbi:hypothetical protein [Escherichia coli]|uniref:hypothetical protein n=1 Tax=Escherichia coli TaxID=562 RepID=UPI00321BDAB1
MQNADAGIVEAGPAPGAGDTPAHLSADTLWSASGLSSFPDRFVIPFLLIITGITPVPACFSVDLHRFNKIRQGLKEYSVQISEALISEPGKIQRFVQQAVDH